MTPTIGQIMVYHARDGDVAAIVTAVGADGTVSLTLFPPGRGTESKPHVREGEGLGCWSWPPVHGAEPAPTASAAGFVVTETSTKPHGPLKVGEGFIDHGEAFPVRDVTPALLTLGWVRAGTGRLPADQRTHAVFTAEELAALRGSA